MLAGYPQALHTGTTAYVQEPNQPEGTSLLGQAPGHLGNAVSRLKPTQESDPGGRRQPGLASVGGTVGGMEAPCEAVWSRVMGWREMKATSRAVHRPPEPHPTGCHSVAHTGLPVALFCVFCPRRQPPR